jgi:PKD repeat protein
VFTVKLTATGAGGTNSTTKTVNITAPTKYTITKVTIDSIPFTNANGGSWDIGAGPDIYFKITDLNAVVLWSMATSSSVKTKDQKSLPLHFSLNTPYQSSDLKNSIGILVYDYDSINSDDLIGFGTFEIPILTKGSMSYPTSVSSSYKGTKITISLTWQ